MDWKEIVTICKEILTRQFELQIHHYQIPHFFTLSIPTAYISFCVGAALGSSCAYQPVQPRLQPIEYIFGRQILADEGNLFDGTGKCSYSKVFLKINVLQF